MNFQMRYYVTSCDSRRFDEHLVRCLAAGSIASDGEAVIRRIRDEEAPHKFVLVIRRYFMLT